MSVSGCGALHLKSVRLAADGAPPPLLKDGVCNVAKSETWRITKVLYKESAHNIGKE